MNHRLRLSFTPALVLATALALAGCSREGTCEYRYDQASSDGSIPSGLEVCLDHWVRDQCNVQALRESSVGLKTSGYTFSKGATCSARGYADCSGGRHVVNYRTCPERPEAFASNKNPASAREPVTATAPTAEVKSSVETTSATTITPAKPSKTTRPAGGQRMTTVPAKPAPKPAAEDDDVAM